MPAAFNVELEAGILADRSDPTPYLVYADWLQERGDPLGELVIVQHALRHFHQRSKTPFHRLVDPPGGKRAPEIANRQDLVKRERELGESHYADWVGPLAAHANDARLRWRMGFVAEASLTLSAQLGRARTNALVDLIDRPAGRLLRSVHLTLLGTRHDEPFCEQLVRAGPISAIEAFLLTDQRRSASSTRSSGPLFRVERFAATFPRLRALTVATSLALDLRALDFPNLESFQMTVPEDAIARVGAIAAARWPKLKTLYLEGRPKSMWSSVKLHDHLAPILEGQETRRLKRLHLRGIADADQTIRTLVASPLLPRLEILDLSRSDLTSDGVEEIVVHADRFQRLRVLVLPLHRMLTEQITALRSACPQVRGGFSPAFVRNKEPSYQLAGV